MEEEELEEFSSLSDDAGEISKHDLIVQTKKSSFWKGNLDLKSKPSGHSTKVIFVNLCKFMHYHCTLLLNDKKLWKSQISSNLIGLHPMGFRTSEI